MEQKQIPKEYDWAVKGCGKVEGGMSISFARSSLTKVADHTQSILGSFVGLRRSHSFVFKSQFSLFYSILSFTKRIYLEASEFLEVTKLSRN